MQEQIKIESTGHKPTDAQRRRTAIERCQAEIVRLNNLLFLLREEEQKEGGR